MSAWQSVYDSNRNQRVNVTAPVQDIGRSRGGRSSKVHAVVDALGRPLRIDITGAQTHDSKAFGAFLDWEEPPLAIIAPSH